MTIYDAAYVALAEAPGILCTVEVVEP